MKFLFPTFLFALLAIAIPIIIHLFSFKRYKTVYFSNVNFLQHIKHESKKQSRLKQLLILAARILTIVFLVFAFAQPYLPGDRDTTQQAQQLVAVYIDNSFSMNALSEQGQLLEVARNKALEIALAYPAETKFQLYTNDLEPRHQHQLNKEQFIQQVSEIQASPAVIPLSLVYQRFANIQYKTKHEANKNLYFISDFQRSISDPENFEDNTIFSYFLPLKANEVANLYIDSCWVEVPAHRLGQEESFFVKIGNSSNQDFQNLPLKLYLNDSLKSITNFSVDRQSEVIAELSYINNLSGLQLGRLEISDYPFTHDNNWYISYKVDKNLKALLVHSNTNSSKEGSAFLNALFENDDYVLLDAMNAQNLQVNRLSNYNTIFLVGLENYSSGFLNRLHDVVKSGSSVVVFPSMSKPLVLNQLLARFGAPRATGIDSTTQEIAEIEFDNVFYKGVFKKREKNPIAPAIVQHLRFERPTQSTESNLLEFQNGDKALSQLAYGDGKLWVFSFALDASNSAFAADILFVPTNYNFVLNSLPKQELAFTVGANTFWNIPRNVSFNMNSSFEIENLKNGDKLVPNQSTNKRQTRLDFGTQISSDGHYLVKNDGKTIAAIAFNYNRKESDLQYYSPAELTEKLNELGQKNTEVIEQSDRNFSEIFDEIQRGHPLWKWAVAMALLCIVAEVLIARLWK